MRIFAVGTKILGGGAGQHWGGCAPGPSVEPPLLISTTYNEKYVRVYQTADDVGFHNANGRRCKKYFEPLETTTISVK